MAELKVIGEPDSPRRFVLVAVGCAVVAASSLVVFQGLFGWLLPLVFGVAAVVAAWSSLAARAEVRAHRELIGLAARTEERQRVTLRAVEDDGVELGLGEGRIARAAVDPAARQVLKGARRVELVGEIRPGRHVGLVLDGRRLVIAGLTDLLERR